MNKKISHDGGRKKSDTGSVEKKGSGIYVLMRNF